MRYRREVTGFSRDGQGRINGIRVGAEEIHAGTVIVAAGAWTGRTMALAGLEVPMMPQEKAVIFHPGPGRGL